MDFHTLTRKELQTLCKKNKIPANMTNVAMADALAALGIVEGLDELMNQSKSPEKAVTESPAIPRTVNRTSTRRKPIKEDQETAQPTTRTRRTARRTLDKDLDQENQNMNVAETPAVPASRRRAPAASASKKMETQVKDNVEQETSFVLETETPLLQTSRRRAQVGSTRRKVEDESAQHVYSTRRSVRLLEKTLADLSLKEVAKAETVKEDVCRSLEKNNDSEVSSGAGFLKLVEDERDFEEDDHEQKSNDNGVEGSQVDTQNSVNLDNVSVFDAKDDNYDQSCDESDDRLGENSNKANKNEMGSVDIPGTDFMYETENASIAARISDEVSAQVVEGVVPVPKEAAQKDLEVLSEDHITTSEKNSEADSDNFIIEVMESEEPLAAKISDEVSTQVVEGLVPVPKEAAQKDLEVLSEDHITTSEKNLEADSDDFILEVMESEEPLAAKISDEVSAQVVEGVVPVPKEAAQKDLEVLFEDHITTSEKNSEADSDNFIIDSDAAQSNMQVADECIEKESPNPENDVGAYSFDDPSSETEECDSEDELFDVDLIEAEDPISYENKAPKLDNPDIEKEEFDEEGLVDVKLIEAEVPISDEQKNVEKFATEELFDASLTEAAVPGSCESKTPKSVKLTTPSCDMGTTPSCDMGSISISTLPIDSTFEDKTPSYRPISPLGADSFSSQFPRPTQSPSKKQGTSQKLTLIADNKENIHIGGMQLESKKDTVKKTKNRTDEDSMLESLNEKSLRELSKMLKEKLQITNKKKNNEDQNITKQMGKARPALQVLPENNKEGTF